MPFLLEKIFLFQNNFITCSVSVLAELDELPWTNSIMKSILCQFSRFCNKNSLPQQASILDNIHSNSRYQSYFSVVKTNGINAADISLYAFTAP